MNLFGISLCNTSTAHKLAHDLLINGLQTVCFISGMQFPIGIDTERFIRALEIPEVQNYIKEYKQKFSGRKVSPLSTSRSLL